MTAAIASYPELGNHPDRQLPVGTRWGVIEEVLNVEEATVEFVKNVLDELIDVFPSPYINVGGDECPRVEWAASTRAQDRKRELGLSTDDQLQAWFIAELGKHLALRGRKLIGWDEILDGGIAENATVLSWRGEGGGITAAKAGHDVVMAPEDRVYLDHYQADPSTEPWAPRGLNTLEAILGWDPVPVELTPAQATRVLGAQANVWVEYIPTREHLDYMVLPRLCALADVAWGSPERDPADFVQRLGDHLRRLDALGVGYRKP
jgi:hexosaminidase